MPKFLRYTNNFLMSLGVIVLVFFIFQYIYMRIITKPFDEFLSNQINLEQVESIELRDLRQDNINSYELTSSEFYNIIERLTQGNNTPSFDWREDITPSNNQLLSESYQAIFFLDNGNDITMTFSDHLISINENIYEVNSNPMVNIIGEVETND